MSDVNELTRKYKHPTFDQNTMQYNGNLFGIALSPFDDQPINSAPVLHQQVLQAPIVDQQGLQAPSTVDQQGLQALPTVDQQGLQAPTRDREVLQARTLNQQMVFILVFLLGISLGILLGALLMKSAS